MITTDDLASIKVIYNASFPEEEQRPWNDLTDKIQSGKIRLEVARGEAGCVLGFATVWRFGTFSYIEHLAVDASGRGLGVGGRLLDSVVRSEGKPVLVEVEPADTGGDARRRIVFYERHGFVQYPDFAYVQPPYCQGLPEVPLMFMVSENVGGKVLVSMSSTLHKEVYGRKC